mmetsp:Transcript_83659/g.233004  ORF Transcript_83659/g.233004 Transcript_83659/m.233004 type:complete len:143 (+) Transcript_83659:44-472(+)
MALPMRAPMKAAMKAVMKALKPSMKSKGAMKAVMKKKPMRVMKVSKVAKGRMAKVVVFSGRKEKTSGGLKKADLTTSKSGKIVSKARSAHMKKRYATSPLKKWADAVKSARKALGITGFVPVGGQTAVGKALLAKVRATLAQ